MVPKEQAPDIADFVGDGFHLRQWTNLNMNDPKHRVLAMRARQKPTKDGKDIVNLEFNLMGIVAHWVDIPNDQTGEVNTVLRTVLITTDGKTYSFAAASMVQAIGLLTQTYGMGPWPKGMPVKVALVTTRRKRQIYEIIVDEKYQPPQ